MSDNVAIQVEGLGKKYMLGETVDWRRTWRRVRSRWSGQRPAAPGESGSPDEFWALRDATFSVKRGEALGIIGSNGAGKSTLLKMLSRITVPTEGRASLYGRVGSLLEVGTGFNPALTGRENIYLNGSILGMRKTEIDQKFDAIVDFAGTEKFLDTPVKRYSSGMRVRLGFAVAAHLEPEILIVDEVLSVGDAEFRRKCLGKMSDATGEGRTVLLVSHNMGSVRQLCERGIWIEQGRIAMDGPIGEITDSYLTKHQATGAEGTADLRAYHREGELGQRIQIRSVALRNASGKTSGALRFGEPFVVEYVVRAEERFEELTGTFGIESDSGSRVLSSASEDTCASFSMDAGHELTLRVPMEGIPLNVGTYSITLGVRTGRVPLDHTKECLVFHVLDTPHEGVEMVAPRLHGHLRYAAAWRGEPGA